MTNRNIWGELKQQKLFDCFQDSKERDNLISKNS